MSGIVIAPAAAAAPRPTAEMIAWVAKFDGGPAFPPVDLPGAVNTPPAPLSDADCMRIIKTCKRSWKEVKKRYLADKVVMVQLVAYRKKVVNAVIGEVDQAYGGTLIAKAVGSDNLTSDYDITFASRTGDGSEIDAVQAFNDRIKKLFGVPPGICFDTNAYVKDFLTVEDKSILGSSAAPRSDGKPIDPVELMLAMDRSDQDVGALTKQRQYMDVDQWDAYCESVLDGLNSIADNGARAKAIKETKLQFSEAESTYALKATEKIRAVCDLIRAKGTDQVPDAVIEELDKQIELWDEYGDKAAGHALTDKLLATLAEHFEAESMEANNALYLQKMKAARTVQEKQKLLEQQLAAGTPPPLPDGTPDVGGRHARIAIDALKAQAKKEITDANYFAAEAYLSEGPLQHIVSGMQGGTPQEKAAAIARLRPEHLLGSMNEQFGDFMKDCGHYKANMGEAFCQTSKYVERMLQSVVLLKAKPGFADLTLDTIPIASIPPMVTAIGTELLPIRGAKGTWADRDDQARFAAAAVAAPAVYGVTTMAALQTLMQKLAVEVNTKVRAAISAAGGMRAGDGENAAFFHNRANG